MQVKTRIFSSQPRKDLIQWVFNGYLGVYFISKASWVLKRVLIFQTYIQLGLPIV